MNRRAILLLGTLLLHACGGGSSGNGKGSSMAVDDDNRQCVGQCAEAGLRLEVADTGTILAQAIQQAQALGVNATIAVVDRVGNVLAVHRMPDTQDVTIATRFPASVNTGLEGILLPAVVGGDTLPAIAKALTAAYLSSEGNAFSTRTANQIVQEHFNPGEFNQPGGPLFGVQFSQLACGDFVMASPAPGTSAGPQRSPLGLSADPGGFPLYKGGTPVGGVGVIADGQYSIDRNILDRDRDIDEMIAFAATFGYAAPRQRRANRITVEGKTLRFSDVDFGALAVDPGQAPAYNTLQGAGGLLDVPGYGGGTIVPGTVFGRSESGIRPATAFGDLDAFTFVDDAGQERFPPSAGGDAGRLSGPPLSKEEVRALLAAAVGVANRSRAQIRIPLGTPARVTVSVVDSQGRVLGMLRSRDAPVFGADVSLQKARTATLFSSRDAANFLRGLPDAIYIDLDPDANPIVSVRDRVSIGGYVDAVQEFVGPTALTDGIAFSDRAGGNLSRPFYPDGIRGNPSGPFSKSFAGNAWSVFSSGLQLDLVINQIIQHVAFVAGLTDSDIEGAGDSGTPVPDAGTVCTGAATAPRVANGIQIFPGSVPIYRGDELIGGIGVSGDGVDQDDMIAFLGVHEAGLALGGSINNAPRAIRADQLAPRGDRLRYVQCPQTPFIDSSEQQVCAGK